MREAQRNMRNEKGQFVKGSPTQWTFKSGHEGYKTLLGKKFSDEHRKNLSLAKMGTKNANFGKSMPERQKRKIRNAHKGVVRPHMVGHVVSEETRRKISDALKGEKSHFWKGGITEERARIYTSIEYKNWRKSVFARDNFACVFCGSRTGEGTRVILNADHIKPFSVYPKFRFDVSNGRTLCLECHKKTPTYGMNKKYVEVLVFMDMVEKVLTGANKYAHHE